MTVSQLIKENDNQSVTDHLMKCAKRGDNLFVVSGHSCPDDYGYSVEYVCSARGGHTVYRRLDAV